MLVPWNRVTNHKSFQARMILLLAIVRTDLCRIYADIDGCAREQYLDDIIPVWKGTQDQQTSQAAPNV
jgi:hypothetical protein